MSSCTMTVMFLVSGVAPRGVSAVNDVSVCVFVSVLVLPRSTPVYSSAASGVYKTQGIYTVSNVGNYTFTYTYGTGT